MKKIFTLLILAAMLTIPGRRVFAVSYKVNYTSEYFSDTTHETRVIQKIDIINLRSDTFVKELTLFFPKPYLPQGIKVIGGGEGVTTDIEARDNGTNLTFHLPISVTGKDSHQLITLEYHQNEVIKKQGRLWEIFIPAITSDSNGETATAVHLPKEAVGPLSIAKPSPSEVNGQTITWRNNSNKSIYAVIGDRQKYHVTAVYHLMNKTLFDKEESIALPPETAFQTVQIDKLDPMPKTVAIDKDGNYLAFYNLRAGEKKTITLSAYVTVLARPQVNWRSNGDKVAGGYWVFKSADPNQLPKLDNPEAVFNYVVNILSYDYSRVNKTASRLGPDAALQNPTRAVCTEYTDLFIAMARREGFMAREINGFAFSNDSRRLPLSLVTDILHSWPEYYDVSRQLWVPVDPTWTDTASLDYFHSFDLNHIVFAIHSGNPDSPKPAGMYKTDNSKDVVVELVDTIPSVSAPPKININMPSRITSSYKGNGSIIIKNSSPVFIKNSSLQLVANGIIISPKEFTIALLPPLGQQQFNFRYQSSDHRSRYGTIRAFLNRQVSTDKPINIVSSGQSVIQLIIGIILGLIVIGGVFLARSTKK